jgi:magnesium-dependent phosphatase 1
MSSEFHDVGFNSSIISYWEALDRKPKVIVLDLDHTLWQFYVDLDTMLPFIKSNEGNGTITVLNPDMTRLNCFQDVRIILNTLVNRCYTDGEQLAIASRVLNRSRALELLELFKLKPNFSSIQICSVLKCFHMSVIKENLGIEDYSDMLFFDDNKFNVREVAKLGVCSFQVRKTTGLNLKAMKNGLGMHQRKFNDQKKRST